MDSLPEWKRWAVYASRSLWRDRAFLLEQFREQYLERGRAMFTHSRHAQTWPLASSSDCTEIAAFLGVAFLAGDEAEAATFDAVFLGAAGMVSSTESSEGARPPVNIASSSEVLRRAPVREDEPFLLAFSFGVAADSSNPSGMGGRESIAGRLFGQSQHRSIVAGRINAGRCRPQDQCP